MKIHPTNWLRKNTPIFLLTILSFFLVIVSIHLRKKQLKCNVQVMELKEKIAGYEELIANYDEAFVFRAVQVMVFPDCSIKINSPTKITVALAAYNILPDTNDECAMNPIVTISRSIDSSNNLSGLIDTLPDGIGRWEYYYTPKTLGEDSLFGILKLKNLDRTYELPFSYRFNVEK
jgi:hypothetical protein